jgi:transposase
LPQLLVTRTDVLSPRMLRIIGDIVDDWKYLDGRIDRVQTRSTLWHAPT